MEDYAFMSYISEIATKAKQVFLVPYLPRLVVRAEGITASLAAWKNFFGAQHFFKNLLSALVKVSNLHTSLLTRFFYNVCETDNVHLTYFPTKIHIHN